MIEEIKLITELLSGIQQDAYPILVSYLVFEAFKWVAMFTAVLFCLVYVTLYIKRGIEAEMLALELASILRGTKVSYVTEPVAESLRRIVKEHKEV